MNSMKEFAVQRAKMKELSGCQEGQYTVIRFDEKEPYYFREMMMVQGEEEEFLPSGSEIIHVGTFQDSVILGKVLGRILADFRFFPYKDNRVHFYSWDRKKEPVYVWNSGEHDLEVDTPHGWFLVPAGECHRMGPEPDLPRLEKPVVPAIDRYCVWDVKVDEEGRVSYRMPD